MKTDKLIEELRKTLQWHGLSLTGIDDAIALVKKHEGEGEK